jgi:signal transduction histidine kinase
MGGLRLALEASRTGVCLFAQDGRARLWNSAFLRLLGYEPDEEVTWSSFLAHLGTTPAPGEEFSFWTPDGVFVGVRLTTVQTGQLLVSLDDLTMQERERATRDRFMVEFVDAQERQARHIAELLHDDAVQQLTALGLQLELAAERSGDESLTSLAASAGAITGSLRRLVIELHPAILESQGLAAAIEASAQSLRARGVEVEVPWFEHRLAAEVELTAYRLVQEALANALRHARARRVEVELTLLDEALRGRVSDDGDGFDPELISTAVRDGRLGLHLVRERVEMARGRFLVESRAGAGTTFTFELPLAEAAARRAVGGGVS